ENRSLTGFTGENRFNPFDNGRGHEDHPGSTSIGAIVSSSVAIIRPTADIVYLDLDYSSVDRAANDAFAERSLKHRWKEREDVKSHGDIDCGEKRTTLSPAVPYDFKEHRCGFRQGV